MPEIALQAVNLAFAYPGGQKALRDLSLSVRTGQRLALLGANGVGKTTLLLHLNGTLKPHSGRVEVDGVPADYGRKGLLAWRQKVGLVFQDPDDQLFAATVAQDVSFGPINLGLPTEEVRHRVRESLAALDISDLAQRPTHMLSFGQKKLAAIAGVLAMRPSVMVLDEPTSGLDFHAAGQFLQTVDRLHRSGTTLVLATHDIDLAYAWADEVALFEREAWPARALRMKSCGIKTCWPNAICGCPGPGGGHGPSAISRDGGAGRLAQTQAELLAFCRQLRGKEANRG